MLELVDMERRVKSATEEPWTTHALMPDVVLAPDGRAVGSFRKMEDADFSAHARTDIPTLLGEIRRMRSEITDLVAEIDASEREMDDGWWLADRLRAILKSP